ncbi:hypothetical protein DFH08DRAFT_781334 [Mycena albidolilacea]|uniref:DUF7779 domain-containing protein n=1 Tax=Mycena albidolilacea TaxID=1033008 RepID=A0AAD7EQK4_9AGAR|nr:hypothetical protein DFH08DRAFT_781334 [Mycena albidolilacea]
MAVVNTNFTVADMSLKINEIHATTISPSTVGDGVNHNTNSCPPSSRIFYGRKIILDAMHQYFGQDTGKQHIYVLYGLGGAGKTQIALRFIEESSKFTVKIMVDASTTETIDASLKNLAAAWNGNSSQDALLRLASKHEKWLLFFDNADDPKINLNKFFPKCNHGNIIITSRNPDLRVYGGHSLVSDMEEQDAGALLLRSAAQETSPVNELLAAEIVKELAYLPLAIVQAGAFISKSRALDTYLELYQENQAQLLAEKEAQTHDTYNWTVYTTWQMSFDKLSPLAAMFLQLCSFLHRDGISEDIFSRAVRYNFPEWGPSTEDLQKPLEFLSYFLRPTGAWDSLRFSKVTNEIKAYSLINFDPNQKIFSIHPLVHGWCRTTVTDQCRYQSCMSAILGMSISQIPREDRQLASLRLISHVDFLMYAGSEVASNFDAQFASMYHYAAQYTEAVKIGVIALERRRKLFGDDNLGTVYTMHYLAMTYNDLGQSKDAQKLQVEVLQKRRKLLGDDHPDTLKAMNNLAVTYHHLAQYKQAQKLQVAVLEKLRKLLGDGHSDTLIAMENLAITYSNFDQHKEAEKLDTVVLEKRRKLLGDDHPDTLKVMENLAIIYQNLGRHGKVEKLKHEVLEKRRKILGNDHPDTLNAMENFAITCDDLGRYGEGAKLKVEVLEKRRQGLGDDHPDTLKAMNNLAVTYWHLNQFQEAERLQVVVLEKWRRLLGEGHPKTVHAMMNLVLTYHYLDQPLETEKLEKLLEAYQPVSEVTEEETTTETLDLEDDEEAYENCDENTALMPNHSGKTRKPRPQRPKVSGTDLCQHRGQVRLFQRKWLGDTKRTRIVLVSGD